MNGQFWPTGGLQHKGMRSSPVRAQHEGKHVTNPVTRKQKTGDTTPSSYLDDLQLYSHRTNPEQFPISILQSDLKCFKHWMTSAGQKLKSFNHKEAVWYIKKYKLQIYFNVLFERSCSALPIRSLTSLSMIHMKTNTFVIT